MSEQAIIPTPVDVIKKGTLIAVIETNVPVLQASSLKAQEAMKEIISKAKLSSEEEVAAAKNILLKVSATFTKLQTLRKEITKPMDLLSDYVMQYEKPLSNDTNAKSDYNIIKRMIGEFEQEKIRKNKEAEEIARKQKLKEQAFADLKGKIKMNVSDTIISLCKRIETGSQEFFGKLKTLEEFDKSAAVYKGTKWKMKLEDYEKCFQVAVSILIPNEEFGPFILSMKEELTYESVNALYLEKGNPLISIWISKIPQLRENLVELLKASDDEKVRLEAQNKLNADAEAQRSAQYLTDQQNNMQRSAEAEASIGKIEADFKEQAVVQTLEPTGPKKKVFRFTDDKPVQALCEVIYHCFMNKDFDGIYKLNKDNTPKLDAQGRPEYVDGVAWWITQFQRLKIDADIKGSEVLEDAKVIVRR